MSQTTSDLIIFYRAVDSFKSDSQTFRWPKKPDEIWPENSSVLCLTPPPRETKRGYTHFHQFNTRKFFRK